LQDNVYFLGWVDSASSAILPLFDIFIQSSLWEAMSVVILEAMMAGKAIVATKVGENVHVIDNGINGYLVEPGSTEKLVYYMDKLIRSKPLRDKLGTDAQLKSHKNYTIQNMINNYEELYLDIQRKK
jgi:glycosyltransferase involved in cell wall biosynthesis